MSWAGKGCFFWRRKRKLLPHNRVRDFLIFDCDEFTKEFYRRNFHVEDFTPLNVAEPASMPAAQEPPVHDGFGSYEDSMQSVLSLKPKPPKANVAKLLEFDNQVCRSKLSIRTRTNDAWC